MNWLLLHDIYFEYDRPDKRTSGKSGRADFRICFKGQWISAECKAAGEKLSPEQSEQAQRLMRSAGIFLLIFTLDELIKALREIPRVGDHARRTCGITSRIKETINY